MQSHEYPILSTMHVLNFLITLLLPYVSLLTSIRPPDSIPIYFSSDEAAFIACEFYAIVFYWAGFLRNTVDRGSLSERSYFAITFSILVFMCASKIVFALPYTWIISTFAFGLGVLSATRGQSIGRFSMTLLITSSLLILAFTGYILLGMAWFNFDVTDYYYALDVIQNWFHF